MKGGAGNAPPSIANWARGLTGRIQTFTGGNFWPLDPWPEEVDIRDIAHALSMKCRYGGHTNRFYSVAEHSILVAHKVGTLEALLHDAAEAYSPFGDVPRPIKADVPWVHKIETPIERAIATKFGLKWPWDEAIKAADNAITADEKKALMGNTPPWPGYETPLGVEIVCWPPFYAEKVFLSEFERLSSGR